MKVGDKVSITDNKHKGVVYAIKSHKKGSAFYRLAPKPDGYCCNYFQASELKLVNK